MVQENKRAMSSIAQWDAVFTTFIGVYSVKIQNKFWAYCSIHRPVRNFIIISKWSQGSLAKLCQRCQKLSWKLAAQWLTQGFKLGCVNLLQIWLYALYFKAYIHIQSIAWFALCFCICELGSLRKFHLFLLANMGSIVNSLSCWLLPFIFLLLM